MTEILCKWLNEEVKLSKQINKLTFAEDFASGYYLGEILHKFQLQNDFDGFSMGQTADAKLNNFTRLEPVFNLLQIPFDSNIAYDVMMLKHGVATRLLYQLYIALQRKIKSNLTGVAMETMRASAPVKLEKIGTGIYKQRLKTLVPRETDLTLEKVSYTFLEKQQENERRALYSRYKELEAYEKIKQEQRQMTLEKSRMARQRQTELLAKIQAATVHIPKPPSMKTLKAINQRRDIKRKREATQTMENIDHFEKNLKKLVAPTSSQDDEEFEQGDGSIESSVEYLKRIKNRLEEDATAREERAKRRRKVLVDQMKAHQAQEEALRQEQVVQRLMRQSTQERRIAVQLMQARQEKDTIRRNRIFQEKQNEERRLKDFKDALDREAQLCRQAREDYEEDLKRERELHEQIMSEEAQTRYRRHYEVCFDVLGSILDFSCKIAEYRELTEKKVPEKLVREWRDLVLSGQPLYVDAEDSKVMEIELAREEILDKQDFAEYKNMIGEWIPPQDSTTKLAPSNNNILGHILNRLFTMVAPTPPPTPPPVFPEFSCKAVVLGKMFAGKTTTLKRLCQNHRVVRLAIDQLLAEAVESFQAAELEPTIALRSSESVHALLAAVVTVDPPTPGMSGDVSTEKIQENPSVDEEDADQKEEKPMKEEQQDEENRNEVRQDAEEQNLEKQDEEKQVVSDEDINQESSTPDLPNLTTRAKLGQEAMEFLKKGEPVADEILVEILMDAIRKLPDGTGWVIDGFPTTEQQAVMLEKALTGKDVATPVKPVKSRRSLILNGAEPTESNPKVVSGLDVVIMLDVNDELVLRRAYGRTEAKESGEVYHTEFRPPPPGSQTGHANAEKVVSVTDFAFDKEQVQHRISNFHSNWSKLEKLYERISQIRHVDGEADFDTVYADLEQCLFDTLDKVQSEKEELPAEEVKATPSEPIQETQPTPPIPAIIPPPSEETPQKKSQPEMSGTPEKSGKDSGRGRKKDSGGKKGAKSRSTSAKSGKGKRKSRTPSPIPTTEPQEEPPGPPQPQPGDPDWQYVDEEVPLPLAHTLVPYWQNNEGNYLKSTKFIFRQIRLERESIIRYLYQIRVDFKEHLARPDHKQIFVSAWQKDFNEVSDDLRGDEESKAELHQRLDDLRERLWDICDTRKEQVETERSNLMTEGWIEDHLGVLTNHFLTLMQAEIDRFQDTLHVLKDYYSGMQAKIPGEIGPASSFIRMPLVELDMGGPDASATPSAATLGSESSVSLQKTGKKSSEEGVNENEGTSLTAAGSRTKIPLIQRGAPMTTQTADDAAKGKKGKATAPPTQGSESPTNEENLEEKSITEGYNFALGLVTNAVQTHVSEKEREEEEEEKRLKEEEEKAKATLHPDKKGTAKKGPKSANKGGKKGKGSKSKTPTPTPPTPVEEVSEEEKKKKETAVRLRDEYFAGLAQEEVGIKGRLELIRNRAVLMMQDLKAKCEQGFMNMNDWLGARYLREMSAIDSLGNFARQWIEQGAKIKQELRLDQDEFVINSERKVVASPVPPPRPQPVETAQPDVFTVNQLNNLLTQFKDVSPGGMIINKAFVELLADTAALTHGLDALPDMWLTISYPQLLELCSLLSPQSEYIDWRKFLLVAALPWPKASVDQLIKTKKDFAEVDVAGNGWITKDQYDQVDLWFPCRDNSRPESPEEAEDPYPYNRNRNLKNFFFELFCDWEQMPPRLDYINMLIYFSANKDSLIGVFRALSVAAGEMMPKFVKTDLVVSEKEVLTSEKDVSIDEAVTSEPASEIPAFFKRSTIELESSPAPEIAPDVWWLVLHHGSSRLGDSHRFSMSEDPEEKYSMERLRHVYNELGSTDNSPLPIQILMKHSVFLDAVSSAKRHQFPDIRSIFVPQSLPPLDNEEAASDSLGIA